jgi:uncharacterized protein (TIGR02996 family)
MPSAEERAFFDRIRDDPTDDGPRLIYADWLAEHGQPDRAEFVRIQCALDRLPEDDPRRPELRERERVLLEAKEARWTADLAPLVSDWVFRRGVIDAVSVDATQFLAVGAAVFDLAPVRRVRFLNVGDRLARLVQSPLLELVRELDLSGNEELGNGAPNLLARSRHLVRLEALDLGFTGLGDKGLQRLADSPVFANLRSLRINGNEDARIGVPGMRALAESGHLTELGHLDVGGNNLSAAAIQPLFDGPLARRLANLVVHGNQLGDAGTAHLVASLVFTRMAERDRAIDLRRVEMGPAGARALSEAPAMRNVEVLDLEGNVLGDAGLAALAGSPNLGRLRILSLRENRISDDGIWPLTRSELMATLRELDLTGNLITQDSHDRLHEASVARDGWRRLLKISVDSQLRRPLGVGSLARYFRRPQS